MAPPHLQSRRSVIQRRAPRSVPCCSKHKTEETGKKKGNWERKKKSDYSSVVKLFQSPSPPTPDAPPHPSAVRRRGSLLKLKARQTPKICFCFQVLIMFLQRRRRRRRKKKIFPRRLCMTALKSASASNLVWTSNVPPPLYKGLWKLRAEVIFYYLFSAPALTRFRCRVAPVKSFSRQGGGGRAAAEAVITVPVGSGFRFVSSDVRMPACRRLRFVLPLFFCSQDAD